VSQNNGRDFHASRGNEGSVCGLGRCWPGVGGFQAGGDRAAQPDQGPEDEEGITLKAIKARYDAIVRRERLTERELRRERAEITKYEEQALALTSSPSERKEIRRIYDSLRRYLTKGVKLEEREIRQIRDKERGHVKHVKDLYAARIRQLENEIRSLQGAGKKR